MFAGQRFNLYVPIDSKQGNYEIHLNLQMVFSANLISPNFLVYSICI